MTPEALNPRAALPPSELPFAAMSDGGDADPIEAGGERISAAETDPSGPRRSGGRRLRIFSLVLLVCVVVVAAVFLWGRHHVRAEMRADLPQLDGSLVVYGLAAPVQVARDAQGVPHIHASSMNDLVFAQGFVTAQDRLWQMDLLRRHAAGAMAEVAGRSMLDHDRLQRTLQLLAAANRALAALPPEQMHWLQVYSAGVNAAMVQQRNHLPIEFQLLGYRPSPWTPRDSILVELAMFQDLSTGYPEKLQREALGAHLPPDLMADLYPVGSWRDHYPGQPLPDVTAPQPEFKDVPLDESQSKLQRPATSAVPTGDLMALEQTLTLFSSSCDGCVVGSNAWVVAGAHTASGKPMVSNDMHLSLSVPETWYEADLNATLPAPLGELHVAGITLPGTPFVVSGHNAHVAWGFTNLGADVQDLYIEHTRGTPAGAEYQVADGAWHAVKYQREIIHVRGSADVTLDVPLTHHGNMDTPIISGLFAGEARSISLAWTIYDPANLVESFLYADAANDGASLVASFSSFGGPALNLMYADDQGHIGYHAVGRIPIRGDAANPGPLAPVPTDATAPDAATHEWVGYIPFDQLPQATDPTDGILATANARVTADGNRYPITLNWMSPYRTERIYKVLEADAGTAGATPGSAPHPLTPADSLALQNDVFSELDQVIAQRLAYSIDHVTGPLKDDKQLHQAADLLRDWNGNVDANSAAPAIVHAARNVFWGLLLIPKLAPEIAPQLAQGADLSKMKDLPADTARTSNLWSQYKWGESESVEEEIITHTPARWLPAGYATWEDFLATVAKRGLQVAKAPADLTKWSEGEAFPLDLKHPVFSKSPMAQLLIGVPTGTGPQPHGGDRTTVKTIDVDFGPSERFTADLADPDHTTLNLALGQSGDPVSAWYMDQFQDWLAGRTYALPYSPAAVQAATTHTLILNPR